MVSNTALRCLIVDDNREFLETASGVLERGGIDVVGVAVSSAQALRTAAQLRPDIILVDVDLGGEDGFDLAEQLHRQEQPSVPQVILISIHSPQDFAELIANSPAVGFVPKTALSVSAIRSVLRGN
jgi:CheY-like chemotaxis protein